MAPVEPVVSAPGTDDAKDEEREGTEPITIRSPALPELPPLTLEQAQELWEELSQILAS